MKTIAVVLAAIAALLVPSIASAKTTQTQHKLSCHAGYVAKRVRVRKHEHHKFVWVRRWRCVKVKTTTTTTTTTTAPQAPTIPTRASLDPSYTQSPTDPLNVTWQFSASDANTPNAVLPLGTLSLAVYIPNGPSVGGCVINVGGAASNGGTCTTELPHTGTFGLTVSYVGGSSTAAPSSASYTETIGPAPTVTTLSTQTNGSETDYSASVANENGNPLSSGPFEWTVTDTTTSQVVMTVSAFYNIASAYFVEQNEYASTPPYQFIGVSVCIVRPGQSASAPVACSNSIAPSDSFVAQATYVPSSSAPYTGSSSQAVPLTLTP